MLKNSKGSLDLLLVGDSASYALLHSFIRGGLDLGRINAHLLETPNTRDACSEIVQLLEDNHINHEKIFIDLSAEAAWNALLRARKDYQSSEAISSLYIYLLDHLRERDPHSFPIIPLCPYRFIKKNDKYRVFIPGAQNLAILEYFKKNKLAGVPNFFLHNSTLALSFILTPSTVDILETSKSESGDSDRTSISSSQLFSDSGFDIPLSVLASPLNRQLRPQELIPEEKNLFDERRSFLGALTGILVLLPLRKAFGVAHSGDYFLEDQELILKSLKLDGALLAANDYCK